ncbi:proton-conducting transporter transmembrane domain-containing protein [Mycolicibacter sinensis]
MTPLMLLPLLTPVLASLLSVAVGWRRLSAVATLGSALTILGCGVVLGFRVDDRAHLALNGLLRADALSATMLIVIGVVASLATWASIGYVDAELARGVTDRRGARIYGVLTPAFLAAMVLAVSANNIGVVWVAVEATTVVTAFLVGHHRSRAALEATWKYVMVCSVGITVAFLGTVLLHFAARHAGAGDDALHLDVLAAHAAALDPAVTRLAGALLLIGYGAKMGLAPFHTWLADAHSQAPAPVSALMSGVLLSVAFSVLIRLKPIIDAATGPAFLRAALLATGLATLLIAALLLTVTTDLKRLLAYSSMETMGLMAVAAAAGTRLAVAALLLHVLAHGVGKTVLFLAGGQLQAAHGTTAISEITGVLGRSRLVGGAFAVGMVVLLGLPPFAMFASELAIATALADARLAWALGLALVALLVAFAALMAKSGRILLGTPSADGPTILVPATVAAALVTGVLVSLALGVTAGPLTGLFTAAATQLGAL